MRTISLEIAKSAWQIFSAHIPDESRSFTQISVADRVVSISLLTVRDTRFPPPALRTVPNNWSGHKLLFWTDDWSVGIRYRQGRHELWFRDDYPQFERDMILFRLATP